MESLPLEGSRSVWDMVLGIWSRSDCGGAGLMNCMILKLCSGLHDSEISAVNDWVG